MSGAFFAGAWQNHQFPQSVFNGPSGALPPKDTSGYANGLNAQADARINYNSTLLGDLNPYAYGKPGRLSSQTAFLAIPHMLQKVSIQMLQQVVPVLSLPSAAWPGKEVTKLYHSIDDGDVAFTINIDRGSTRFADGPQIFDKVGALRAIDPFCNLVTVNYLLAGIQLYSDVPECTAWTQFIRDIGMYDDRSLHGRIHTPWQILRIIRDVFIPFGVPRGSDQQGGQTQGTNLPNMYPVDHVTSMLMDGKCINLINIWRRHDISSGDDMILVLKKMVPNEYLLSRQTNSYNRQVFTSMTRDAKGPDGGSLDLEERRQAGVWQLVPWVYNMKHEPDDPTEYDFRENGYWHICKALQMFPSDPRFQFDNYNDATKYRTTGELMEVSFQPLFIEGIPDGSSKTVIQGRPDYPRDDEDVGIPIVGNNAPRKSRVQPSLTGAGPPLSVWKTYLKQKRGRKRKQMDFLYGVDDSVTDTQFLRNTRRVVGLGSSYVNVIQNAGQAVNPHMEDSDSIEDDEEPIAVQQGAVAQPVAAAPAQQDAGAGLGPDGLGPDGRLRAALDSIVGAVAANPQAGAQAGRTTANGKKGSTRKAAKTSMGLSGSYISNSGPGEVGTTQEGAIRASLLSAERVEAPAPPGDQ